MPQLAELHVAGLDVRVAGAALDPMWKNLLLEVRVRDTLALPDSALVRLSDPKGEKVDSHPLQLGKDLEIKAGATGERSTSTIFKGQIVSLEPEFSSDGVVIVARALDKGHKLQRERKVRTFQQMSASDMVNKVVSEAGLSADVESTNVVHEFFQQSAETDWEFIARLARMHDYRFYVEDDTLHFRAVTTGSATVLTWQENLISFRPRVSGVQQVKTINVRAWDPKAKQVVTGSASSGSTTSAAGLQRTKVSNDLGGGTTVLADRVAATSGEANALAKSALDGRSDAYFEAEGTAFGMPALKAGATVEIKGVGRQLGGKFVVSASTHVYKGKTGYQTNFQIAGRSERGLLDLVHPPERHDWSRDLVVGVVTNNNDPEQMGRVRVKFPSLSDSEESGWARIASVSAGNGRGLMMLPQPDEEVIIGFEHGDTRRPIVIGSLFNGNDKPGDELAQNRDGSLGVVSNEKVFMHSKKDMSFKSDEALLIEVTKDATTKAQGKIQQEASQGTKLKAGTTYEIEAGSSMTIKGMSVTVEASASLTLKGATVDVQASGPLNLKGAIINIG